MLASIIFMMILPLPTWLVDAHWREHDHLGHAAVDGGHVPALTAGVFQLSIGVADYHAVSFGISIATTRLILLARRRGTSSTPSVTLWSGATIVGLVVFLILTIVQFVVITIRAPERVMKWRHAFRWTPCLANRCQLMVTCAGTIDMQEAKACAES